MNPDNFILNSDYPLEKIAGLFEFSGTTGASTSTMAEGVSFQFTNTVGVPLLIDGQFSFTPDFTVAYPLMSEDENRYFSTDSAYTTRTTIYISGSGYGGARPIYFRIWGFVPEDTAIVVPSTASASQDNFVLDTRKNYLKVFKDGRQKIGADESFTIQHNLGYIPYFKVWLGSGSSWQVVTYGSGTLNYAIDSQKLVLTDTSGYGFNYYYRVYANEA